MDSYNPVGRIDSTDFDDLPISEAGSILHCPCENEPKVELEVSPKSHGAILPPTPPPKSARRRPLPIPASHRTTPSPSTTIKSLPLEPISPAPSSPSSVYSTTFQDPFPTQDRALSLPLDSPDEPGSLRQDRSNSEPYGTPTRKFSRKLPPKLTESLEALVLTPSTRASPRQEAAAQINALEVEYPLVEDSPTPPSSEAPTRQSSLLRRKSSKLLRKRPSATPPPVPSSPISVARRNMSISTIRPSTASTTGSHLLTPSSSVRDRVSYEARSHNRSCSSGSASTCGTWSMEEFENYHAGPSKPKESRKTKKERKRAEKAAFDVATPPTMRALYDASLMDVIDEHGDKVKFGDLVRRGRTIVIFIRHWFCPLCAQYMKSIVDQVSPEALEEADVEMVIIGNGSAKMLPAYKNKAMKCPFTMYTDPTLSVYRALGLTRQTGDAGPDSEAGDYLVQTPLQATLSTLKRATQMPLANPGHFFQLGGEFIFDGTLNVSYTHRMSTTRGHAPIRDICAQAGVRLEWVHYEPGPSPPWVHRMSPLSEEASLDVVVEENDWRAERDREVARIKAMKELRRMGLRGTGDRGAVYVVGEDGEGEEAESEDGQENRMEGLGLAY